MATLENIHLEQRRLYFLYLRMTFSIYRGSGSSPLGSALALERAFCVLLVLSRHHRGGCDKRYLTVCSL